MNLSEAAEKLGCKVTDLLKGATVFVLDEHCHVRGENKTIERIGTFSSREGVNQHLATLGTVLEPDEDGNTVVHVEDEFEGMPYAYDAVFRISEEIVR